MMRRAFGALLALACIGCAAGGASAPTEPAAPAAPYLVSPVTIPAGSVQLSGRLYAPSARRYPVVVMVAGSGLDSIIDAADTRTIARAFTDRGIGVLVYDKRGTGESTGAFTNGDFEGLGADAAAALRFADALPAAEAVGIWAHSQAVWYVPYAVAQSPDLAFAILVSSPGVNPHEQVAHFLRTQALTWGLTPEEADAADRMHRAVALYYAGRESYAVAQAEVDSHRGARWFRAVVTHPYWDEMTPEGAILDPQRLAAALRERPGAFEIYSASSSFVDYEPLYQTLRMPTFVIYGGADDLLPVALSRSVLERTLSSGVTRDYRVFEGATHEIKAADGQIRQDYLDAIGEWARAEFARR